MAITLINAVKEWYPAYNPIFMVVDSSNKTNDGFNYILDIYNSSNVFKRRYRFPVDPTISTQYGYADISRQLAELMEDQCNIFDLDVSVSARTNTEQTYKAILQFGEEYVYNYTLTYAGQYNTAPFTNRVFVSGGTAHGFAIGDLVTLSSFSSNLTGLNNTFTIVALPDEYSFAVNYGFVSATSVSASAKYASNEKVIYTGLTSASTIVYDCALSVSENYSYFNKYTVTTASTTAHTFLTNMPQNYKVRLDNAMGYLNIYSSASTSYTHFFVVTDAQYTLKFQPQTTNGIIAVPFTPTAINASYGSTVIDSTITSYYIYLSNLGQKASEYRYFKVDNDGRPEQNYEVVFEDIKGSIIPINFKFLKREEATIERIEYKSYPEYTMNGAIYIEDKTKQVEKYSNISSNKIYTLTTDWISDNDITFYEDLLQSKRIWLKDGSDYIPIQILNTSLDIKRRIKDGLFFFEIQFKKSYQKNLNN